MIVAKKICLPIFETQILFLIIQVYFFLRYYFFPVESVVFFNGAPTAMVQSCPGCPWGGFIPGAVTTGAGGGAAGCDGDAGGTVTGASGVGEKAGAGVPEL